MKKHVIIALLATAVAAALLLLWLLPESPAGSAIAPPGEPAALPPALADASDFPTPPPAAPLPMAAGPRTELPDNPAGLPEGFVAPPDFADTIFGDDGDDDPAWVALQDQIEEAMTTWSEEGLAVLEPLLSHPSARVRAETVDAIIQMDLPAASPMLRAAARRASSAAERRRLEQAADFNDLPSVSSEQLRQIMAPAANTPPADR
jgi:hypothetical protein